MKGGLWPHCYIQKNNSETDRRLYLHVVENFEKCERHAAADDHLVHFIQHALDQLDLVGHLRSEQNNTDYDRRTGLDSCVGGTPFVRIASRD